MLWRGWICFSLLFVFVLGGCATSRPFSASSSAKSDDTPRIRCLSEPEPWVRGSGDRPLIFLFCIQSP